MLIYMFEKLLSYNSDISLVEDMGKVYTVETNCRKCLTPFIIQYNDKNATCKILKSCECGFNED